MKSKVRLLCAASLGALMAGGVAHADDVTDNPAEGAWSVSATPKAGVAVPTSRLGPMAVAGAEIGYLLPVLEDQLLIAVDGHFTRPPYDASISDDRVGGDGAYEVDVTEFKAGLAAHYRLGGPADDFVPFVGAGPILHVLRTRERDDFDPGENTSRNSEIGAELAVGADYRVGPGYLTGEGRFLYSDLAHLYTGDTNAGNLLLAVGYRAVF